MIDLECFDVYTSQIVKMKPHVIPIQMGKCTSSPDWIRDNLVEHVYMNRYVAGLDFVGHKTKPLEVLKFRTKNLGETLVRS